MEGWTFRWETSWTSDRIKAFLDGVDVNDMVVFDMNSEYVFFCILFDLQLPQYKKIGACGKRVYFISSIHPQFIYGLLPNYGSQQGLYGNLWKSVEGPQEARTEFPDLMIGIGTFMEGIDQNYVIYDAFYISLYRSVENWNP